MINEKEKRNSDYLYLMVEFPSIFVESIPHYVVYYEPDGDEIYQFRSQADIVTVPDNEILLVSFIKSLGFRFYYQIMSDLFYFRSQTSTKSHRRWYVGFRRSVKQSSLGVLLL